MFRPRCSNLLILFVIPVCMAGCLDPATAPKPDGTVTVLEQGFAPNKTGILPPASMPYGKSYGEWSGDWWQWALGVPTLENPILDLTGEFCDVGQSPPLWFLAGSFGIPVERTCQVPVGQAILMPVLNVVMWAPDDLAFADALGIPGDTPEDKLRNLVNYIVDFAAGVEATIDGVPVEGMSAYRFDSPEFPLAFPEDNIAGMPAGPVDFAVSDGYWLILPPLFPGPHTIHVQAAFVGGPYDGFSQDTTYYLTVEGQPRDGGSLWSAP